jgi:hypothetical protein
VLRPIDWLSVEKLHNPNLVKVLLDADGHRRPQQLDVACA